MTPPVNGVVKLILYTTSLVNVTVGGSIRFGTLDVKIVTESES